MRIKAAAILMAALLAVAAAPPVHACLACIAMPEDSLADNVAQAEVVALLRPQPDDPFRYAPVAFLRGGPDVPEVPFLVSRDRAAALAANQDGAVVATWTAAGGWMIHDLADTEMKSILQDVLSRDLSSPQARREFFGPLVLSADPALSRMAMIEISTLPYPVIREIPVRVPRQDVARLLSDPVWADWAPVMILLFGLSDGPADKAFVRHAADAIAENGRTVHLAAWATALIEMDGDAGIAWLRENYLENPDRSVLELREIGFALASHAARDDAEGAAVRDALAELAAAQPAVAGALAKVLLDREDWSLAPDFRRWLDDGLIALPEDEFVITHYVLLAAASESEGKP
ncbi:MAG: hypothetical protein NTX73_14320 [Rhodobacterales bacterium]|nr:hypothetical protein [Rhodobacterales bacterium]